MMYIFSFCAICITCNIPSVRVGKNRQIFETLAVAVSTFVFWLVLFISMITKE